MSLSSLTPTQGTIFAPAPSASAPAGDPAPATRGGMSPSVTPPLSSIMGVQNTNPAAPGADGDPLAAYRAVQQNGTTQQQPTAPDQSQPATKPAAMQPVKLEDLNGVVDSLSKNVKVNDEQVALALRGDAQAFNQVITDVVKQAMQYSIYASTTAAQHLQQTGVQQAASVASAEVSKSQAHQAAVSAAVQANPELATGLNAKLLETTLASLRTEYPTAPAELLGKEAARLLGASAQQPADQVTTETDWLKFTQG